MSPADLTDDQLGREALRGDRAAFTELFGRHEAGLRAVATRLTGDPDEAADISQEAFLRVFARLDDLVGRDVNLPAYLHRTARNLVYDRSARRGRELPTEEIVRVAGPDVATDADPERSALVAAQVAEVRAANARLPERHRLVLALREVQGMGYADIGRVLDITPGAVAQLLARARAALRRELRLGQVDAGAMDPGCRSRLAGIGALIDGELDPDRAHVLSQHLDLCPACRAARAAFEEARVTYRAWLPLPILGLGAATARAAEARGLVRFSDGRRAASPRARGRGAGAGRGEGPRRRRVATAVAGGVVAFLLLAGAGALVATRTGSSGQEPAPAAAAAAPGTTTGAPAPPPAATATTGTTAATTIPAATAPPAAAPPPPGPAALAVPSGPTAAPAVVTPPPAVAPPPGVVTTAPRRPRPPSVRVARDPAPAPVPPASPDPGGPPATTASEPPPVTDAPVRTDPQQPPPTGPTPPVVTIPPILTVSVPLPPEPVF